MSLWKIVPILLISVGCILGSALHSKVPRKLLSSENSHRFENSQYYIENILEASSSRAQVFCKFHGMDLVSIESPEEDEFLSNVITEKTLMDTRIRCQKITDDDYEQPRLPLLAKWWEDTFQKIGVDLRNETEAREIMESIPRYIIAALKDVGVHVDELSSEDDTIREPEPEDPSCHTTYVEVPQSASKSYPVNTRKQNQYMAFFKRRNPKLWRGVIKAKTFHDKADALMKSIVEDFVSWANENLADDEIDGISYEDVHRMFKYDTSISRCLHFETKRLGCIPDDPTNPGIENWRSTRLRKEILRDAKAYNRPKRTVAFGTCLPPELRSYPTRDTNFLKLSTWASSRRMRSLEGVFAGQTNLTSTKNYCKFLKENHPEVPLPDNITSDDVYEVEAGMWFKKSISSWKSR